MDAIINFSNPHALRKSIRNIEIARPVNNTLGIRITDIGYILFLLQSLESLGENMREFQSYLPDLMLQDLAELKRIRPFRAERTYIDHLIRSRREYLWPSKRCQ